MNDNGALVVDASVAVKWFLPEVLSEHADRVLHSGRALLAPDFLLTEFANVMAKKVKGGELSEGRARLALEDVPDLVRLIPARHVILAALQIAMAYNRSVYDALYVALAQREGSQLVTADQRLINALMPSYTGTLTWLADL